jgi:hypothetical protein
VAAQSQIDKDKLSALFQTANALGDACLWGFHWGRPGDGFDKLAGFDFENDLLRIHAGDRDKHFVSVYSPRGFEIGKGQLGEPILEIRDAQRVRWVWLAGPGQTAAFLEFWRMDGWRYLWKEQWRLADEYRRGIGDQSQPALRVAVFEAPAFLLKDVSGQT